MECTLQATKLPAGRPRLVAVVRAAGDVIKVGDVVTTLSVGRSDAAKLLSRWTRQGWLRRVGPGAYAPAPLDSLGSEHVLTDPWVLVPALYSPGYIGGWTAAQHWDLTEQLFRETLVMTAQPVREKRQTRHGAAFVLRHVPETKIFGTRSIWRGRSKVPISDVHRTIVDMLDDPGLGGGIQHVADCLNAYLKRPDRDDSKLIEYAERIKNGAVFKRLGFLAVRHSSASQLVEACQSRLTKGNSKLDPSLKCPRLISKWRLWVPDTWEAGAVA